MRDDRVIDVWARAARSSWQASPWPRRAATVSAGIVPGERPALAWRALVAAALPVVLLLDLVLRADPGLFVVAVLDEIAHVLTTVLVLAGLAGAGARLTWTTVVSALAAGCLIDLDHVPQLLGYTWSAPTPTARPFTHSITTIIVLVLLLTAVARRQTPARARRLTQVSIGLTIGLLGHFVRDMTSGATAVLWPMSTVGIALPSTLYVLALALAAASWWWRGRWPVTSTSEAPGAPGTAERTRGPGATSETWPALTPWASRTVVALATGAYTWHVSAGMITRLHDYRLAGFDTGIFVQGTWLLSHGLDPFVTVRGLPLFADHASFVLLLVAPLYAVIGDPALLLVLQVLGTAGTAVVLHEMFLRMGGGWAATVFPLLYLLHPGQQWGVTFEFHPESLAPVFLVAGVHLALHSSRRGLWLLPLLVALSCKEDTSFVVAGIGLLLLLMGRYRRGLVALVTGVGYFLVVTSVVMPFLGGGMTSIYFKKNFGIDTGGESLAWIPHLHRIVEMFFQHAVTDAGLAYLMIVLVPVALLSLLDPKWLLPAAGPLFVNLASQVEELHSVQFHYLLTTVPFVILAAHGGYRRLARVSTTTVRRGALVTACVLALVLSAERGALPKLAEETKATPAATRAAADEAVAMIPDDAVVAAGWNVVPNVADRRTVYDFPVPFDKGWWGDGDPPAELVSGVDYVLVRPSVLRDMDRRAYDRLRSSATWRPVVDKADVVLLERVSP